MSFRVLAASDPEWLPSTIVQSSASLVAIVGGLLVARLVGMSSDRGGLVQRLQELNDQHDAAANHYQQLVARRVAWDLSDFLDAAALLYYRRRDPLRSAGELATEIQAGSSHKERLQFAEDFLSYVSKTEPLVRQLPGNARGERTVQAVSDSGIAVPPMYEPVVETMLESLEPPKARNPLGFDLPSIKVPLGVDEAGRTITLQRWDALIGDIDQARRRVAEIERARALASDQLASLTPRGVTGALAALGGVVLAGIAFPVALMALRWPSLTAPWRSALVAAFLASVGGVGIYVYRLARSLA